MGLDCSLIKENQEISLDRWYCFSNHLQQNINYPKKEFCERLEMCIKDHIDDFLEENIDNRDYEDLAYKIYWCRYAQINSGINNKIVVDG